MSDENLAIQPQAAAPAEPARDAVDAPPPFLGTWRNVYALVIGELAATAILFWALTRWAS
ncbi:MAG TPA: hypothetical protein VN033_15460 [Vulgatibacter sp.]|nr:hypothetical protein [Vulgatibacter sp.]